MKMVLTKTEQKLVKIAGCLGVLQALAWIIMSLICIVEYIKNDPPEKCWQLTAYEDAVDCVLYGTFLKYSKYEPDNDFILMPSKFTVFMWIYLILNLIWITESVLQINAVKSQTLTIRTLLRSWSVTALFVSAVDLILVILLGVDYDTCRTSDNTGYAADDIYIGLVCSTTYLPVLVIAARGFTLWIINIIFAFVLFKISTKTRGFQQRILSADPQLPRVNMSSQQPDVYGVPPQMQNVNAYPQQQNSYPYPQMQNANPYSGNNNANNNYWGASASDGFRNPSNNQNYPVQQPNLRY